MKAKRVKNVVLGFIGPAIVVIIWWYSSKGSSSIYFPPLSDIVETLVNEWLWDAFVTHGLPSIVRVFAGFGIAAIAAIVIGTCIGLLPWARRLAWPGIEFLRAMPGVVLVPFGLVVFGPGSTMQLFVIALGSCFPVLFNTVQGVRSADPILLDVAKTFGFTRRERVVRVVLPASLPTIFAGLRTSLALALILMVVSEMVGGSNGIGYSILQAERLFKVPEMWSGLIVLGIVGFLINACLVIVQHFTLGWYRGLKASSDNG